MKIRESGAIALAVLNLIPPPFPFTPFILAAGALEVKTSTFFVVFTVCRLVRFGVEAALARTYGRGVLAMMESDLFNVVVSFVIVLAVGLTVFSAIRLFRPTPSTKRSVVA